MDRRAAGLAAVSGVLIALGAYIVTHKPTAGQEAAQATERGMVRAQSPPADTEAVEDERLAGDATRLAIGGRSVAV